LTDHELTFVMKAATVAAARLGDVTGVPKLILRLRNSTEADIAAFRGIRSGPEVDRWMVQHFEYVSGLVLHDLAAATGHFPGLMRDDWVAWYERNGDKDRNTLIKEAIAAYPRKKGSSREIALWALSLTESALPLQLFLSELRSDDMALQYHAYYGLGHIDDERAVAAVLEGALSGDQYAQKVLNTMAGGAVFDRFEAMSTRMPKLRKWCEQWQTDRAAFRPFPYHRIHSSRRQMAPYETLREGEDL